MGKKINTILNLQDKFTPKLSEAGKKALIFKERVKNTEAAVQKVDSSLSKMAKTAAAVSAAGVAAMGAFAASCVKTYGEFQQSMSNVAGIMGIDATSKAYKNIEKAAREAGESTTKTSKEATDAISYMALAGWTEEQALKGLMPVLRASEATGADLATTSDLITDSMSALGLNVNRLTEYLDMAAQANNKSNETMQNLMEAAIECGGALRVAGIDMYDFGIATGVLGDNGLKGAAAGTALNSMIVRLTSHNKALETMKNLGVDVFDKTTGKFRGLENILTDLNKAMNGFSQEKIASNLKVIAGTNYFSQFQFLLNSVRDGTANTKEFKTRWKELNSELHNSKGALDNMANTMTDNYAGALARAGSAVEALQITVGQKFEPYITKFLNWFSEKLPNVTQKVSNWLERNIPKAVKFCKSAFETIKPAISFVINNFSKLISVAAGVVVGLKAFSVITKVVALYKKLQAAGSALKVVQLALNSSMLACPITWIAAGIATITAGILLYKDAVAKAKEEDLAKHFGNIELSAEECTKTIQSLFGQQVYSETENATAAYEAVQKSIESLSDSSKELNKLNFRLSIDPKSVTKDEYLKVADEYVKNMNEAIKDQQYNLDLGIKLMISDTTLATTFGKDATKFYGILADKCTDLGTKLKNAVENAYKHNWDFHSSEAFAAILKEQAEIQDKIATAQSEARLDTLKYDFSNGDLSSESYKTLMETSKEEIGKLKEAYNQTRIDTIASAKLTYGNDFEKIAQITAEVNETYAKKVSELESKSIALGSSSIVTAYKKEFEDAAKQFEDIANSTLNQKDVYGFIDDFNNGKLSAEQIEKNLENIGNAAVEATSINSVQRENIAELYEAMKDDVEAMREDVKNLETIPEELQKTLIQADIIGAVGGDEDSKEHLASMLVAKSLSPEKAKELFNASEKFGENCPKGIFSNKNVQNGLTAADNFRKVLSERLSQPYTINADVKINFNKPTVPKLYDSPMDNFWKSPFNGRKVDTGDNKTDTNATGTTYFGGGPTTINEHGYEIVDLPAGTRIYPHNTSEKMMNEKQPISVSVIVQGNIFGIDDAIEIIGSRVCDRIVETVNCTA